MKKYYPSYYSDFKCLAAKCPDTCCAKWEIVVDNETYEKYRTLDGEYAEIIKNRLCKNDENEICFLQQADKCPFLNEDGLCDIHVNLGEEYTSRICRDHPRFIEEYDGFTEISLSLSCPKACELIFACESDKNNYPCPSYTGEDDVLFILINSRKRLLKFNSSFSLLSQMVLDVAAEDQYNIDTTYIENHPVFNIELIKNYLYMLLNGCEILNNDWEALVKNTIDSNVTIDDVRSYISDNNADMCNLCKYLLYRYYLKAVNDLDVYSRALFIVMSCMIIPCIALSNSISFEETARLYSKEIEHNTSNINSLLDYFLDM